MFTYLLPLFFYCLELLIALFQLGVKFIGRSAPSETTNNTSNTLIYDAIAVHTTFLSF